jgi:hypothetical protein
VNQIVGKSYGKSMEVERKEGKSKKEIGDGR